MRKIEEFLPFYYGCPFKWQYKNVDGLTPHEEWLDGKVTELFFHGDFIVKPILRRLTSITQEEIRHIHTIGHPAEDSLRDLQSYGLRVAYLVSRHIDLFGLIEDKMAIDADKLQQWHHLETTLTTYAENETKIKESGEMLNQWLDQSIETIHSPELLNDLVTFNPEEHQNFCAVCGKSRREQARDACMEITCPKGRPVERRQEPYKTKEELDEERLNKYTNSRDEPNDDPLWTERI